MTQEQHGSSGVLLLVFGIACAVVVVLFLIIPISRDATRRQESQTTAIQSQERERTERERLSQETAQRAAELRAETTARTQNSVLMLLAAGGIVLGIMVLGGLMIYGLDRADSIRMTRMLLLIEAQRQTQAQPLQLASRTYQMRMPDSEEMATIVNKESAR